MIMEPTYMPDTEAQAYPLSSTQMGMLFHSDLARGEGVYTQQHTLDMPEAVDPDMLQQAFQGVLTRHDLFRTSFPEDASGTPYQVVHARVTLPWAFQDWRAQAPEWHGKAWEALLEVDRRRVWDRASAPLMRCTLVRLGENHWRLLWSHHHALADGGAHVIALSELARIYRSLRRREQLELPPPVPFRDFIRWLGERDRHADEAHWKGLLQGFTEPTEVGELRKDAPFHHQTVVLQLDSQLARQITSFLAAHDLTHNTLVMGAWAMLLSRMTDCEDVVFGATLTTKWSRMHEAHAALGLFINVLPLRVAVSPEAEVVSWLQDLRAQWKALRHHERTPLVEVQRCSGVPAGQPLFKTLVMFDWASGEEGVAQHLPADCSWSAKLKETLDTPLTLAVYGTRQPTVKIGFDTRYFLLEDITRMLGHFQMLLGGLSAGAGQRLQDLSMLTAQERQTLLFDWNATSCLFPQEACIHQLFEAWARSSPARVAVVFEGRSLTYCELDARADRLAHYLRGLGVGPGVLVGIAVERSLELVVGLLAILKAGGAFVPLNPDDPAERLASMLAQAKVSVLLTQERLLPDLPGGSYQVFCLDRDWSSLSSCPVPPMASPVHAEDLAYVIFTSGSTGRPKGVMISHRNVLGFLHAYQSVTQDSSGRVGTNVAPFNFDTSVEEFWSCLCFGGTVHIVRPEHSTDAAYFARYLVDHGITTTYIVPAMLMEVAAHLAADAGRLRLKCLLTGLHAKKERALQVWRDLVPGLRIMNAYGPTETTYGATAFEFQQASDLDRDVPIGVPFPGYQTYILDARLQPVPVGVVGELVVGGIGIARGYLGQPELTERAFVEDPFGSLPGARLYRTGDRCRYRANGVIEFLGRTDQQVKIRGYRVELGEIEDTLARLPALRECSVVALPDAYGGLRLVAYLVGNPLPSLAELRSFLKMSLPEYMIPTAFVPLDALPRTTAGKVDRRSLPIPDQAGLNQGHPYVAPRTPTEHLLVAIWEEVLKVERVGIHDDFFELGGHSLLAFKVISLLRVRGGGVDLPIRWIFESPTPATLAQRINDVNEGDAAEPGLFTVRPGTGQAASGDSVVLGDLLDKQWQYVRSWKGKRSNPESFIVTLNEAGRYPGLFWCLQGYRELEQLAKYLGSKRPVHGMRSGYLIMEYTDENVSALAAHYASEMVIVQPAGPFLLGGNCQGGTIAHRIAQRLCELGRTVSLLILMEQGAFPPHDGPVSLIFGRDSEQNPYGRGGDPAEVFRDAYPAGFTVDIITGAHGQFFEKPNIKSLAKALQQRLPSSR